MTGALRAAVVATALICAAATGCAKHEESAVTTSSPHRVVENPSDFPLYPHGDVIRVVPIDSAQMFAAIRKADPHAELPKGNYRGHEIIAQTSASFAQLSAWVKGLRDTPPAGFHLSTNHVRTSQIDENGTKSDAIAGAEFDAANGRRTVYLFVADPHEIRAQMGVVFDLINNYPKVPGVLRGPIDDQAKQQVGYSVSEMLDPRSPVGAVVAAVKQLQGTSRRAILLVDESQTQ